MTSHNKLLDEAIKGWYARPVNKVKRLEELLKLSRKWRRESEAKVRQYKKAYEAAVKYIDLTPCDPDINEKQWGAWLKFKSIRDELK